MYSIERFVSALPLLFAGIFVVAFVILGLYVFPKANRASTEREKREREEDSLGRRGDSAELEGIELQISTIDRSLKRLEQGSLMPPRETLKERREREAGRPIPTRTPRILSPEERIKKEALLNERAKLVARSERLQGKVSTEFERDPWIDRLDKIAGGVRGLFLSIGLGMLGLYFAYKGAAAKLFAASKASSVFAENLALSLGICMITASLFLITSLIILI